MCLLKSLTSFKYGRVARFLFQNNHSVWTTNKWDSELELCYKSWSQDSKTNKWYLRWFSEADNIHVVTSASYMCHKSNDKPALFSHLFKCIVKKKKIHLLVIFPLDSSTQLNVRVSSCHCRPVAVNMSKSLSTQIYDEQVQKYNMSKMMPRFPWAQLGFTMFHTSSRLYLI